MSMRKTRSQKVRIAVTTFVLHKLHFFSKNGIFKINGLIELMALMRIRYIPIIIVMFRRKRRIKTENIQS